MGLIGWIKGKYYDSRLDKADNLVLENDLERAEQIYRELLGKQDDAATHFTNMLVEHSDDAQSKISSLKTIESLGEFVVEENSEEYKKGLNIHVRNMEVLAKELFNKKQYDKAVSLLFAIKNYHSGEAKFSKKCHKYSAYNQYSLAKYDQVIIKDVVKELQAYLPSSLEDAKIFARNLEADKKYTRGIKLLYPFAKDSQDIKELIIDEIVGAVANGDKDVSEITALSAICNDETLCKNAAEKLVSLSAKAAKEKDYKTAVRYDDIASPYFGTENTFNFARCSHALEEASERANANEIKGLIGKAETWHLTKEQISKLKKRVEKIAKDTSLVKGLDICRIFRSEKSFDLLYIQLAKKLSSSSPKDINSKELLEIIKANTDQETYPGVLSDFVQTLPYEHEFIESAIDKIKRHDSTEFLKRYWSVKESDSYFKKLVSTENEGYKNIVAFIVENHNIFLHDASLRNAFCKSLDSLDDKVYVLNVAKELIIKKCKIEDYFVSSVLRVIKNKANDVQVATLDHAISILADKRLIDKKKLVVRSLIKEKDFDLAEHEAKSLDGVDDESDTILAEAYYAKAANASSSQGKIGALYQVLDVIEKNRVFSSFDAKKADTLSQLCSLAIQAQQSGDNTTAYNVADRLSGYSETWLDLYIKLRSIDYNADLLLSERIKFQQDTLNCIGHTFNSASALRGITKQEYYDLWTELKNLRVKKSEGQPKDKSIDNLSSLRDAINKYCSQSYAVNQAEDLTKKILKQKWSLATEAESDFDYDTAIKQYQSVKGEQVTSYSQRAELRMLICFIKAGKVDEDIESRISTALAFRSHQPLKDDLAYRYACYLIKSIRPGDAENILNKYLPDELDLLNLCKNIYVKESEKYLAEFNKKVASAIKGAMSVDDANSFLRDIDRYKKVIANHLTDTASKFDAYKSFLESYIIGAMFREERYGEAFDKIAELFPSYMNNEQHLRNMAIAALGYIESGEAYGTKLQYAISLWITVVYRDRLFVKSLDYTSWDDDFTFTLSSSLGRTGDSDYDVLPDNINFDDPVENENIAIKDVQTSLITRLETDIRDNYPDYEDYLNREKSALDNLLDINLDRGFVIATPGIATEHRDIWDSIKSALDYELEQDYGNTEDVLRSGLTYNIETGQFADYKRTTSSADNCKRALEQSPSQIKSAFTSLPQIKEYTKLYEELRAFVSSKLNEAVKNKMLYTNFMDKFEPVCRAFNEPQLSFAFSNYANGEVIHRLNDDSLKECVGIGYLLRIYQIAPTSVQVKKNLIGVLQYLVREYEDSGRSEDKRAIDNVVRAGGSEFKNIVDETRVDAKLSVIIDKVNKNQMQHKDALTQLYDLYKQYPDNDRLCENLVTICDMCIMEYVIGQKSGRYSVCNILDALESNRSQTFRKYAGKLKNTYDTIWNQLGFETQMLMEGMGGLNSTLNDKGLALKKGLDYYSNLSGRSRLGSRFPF